MTVLRFTGQVLPRGFAVTLSDHPTLDLMHIDGTYLGTLNLSIENNDFSVHFDIRGPLTDDLEREAMMRAQELVESVTSLISFQHGLGLSFIIERMHYEDGTSNEVAVEERGLPKLVTAIQSDQDLAVIVHLMNSDLTRIMQRRLADVAQITDLA